MAKAILICGRLCSGKTTYAEKLCREHGAVLLSADRLMLTVFGQHCGDMHDEYARRAKEYLLGEAEALITCGTDIVLDWGFWREDERRGVREFFSSRGIPCELHYLDPAADVIAARIKKRNTDVLAGAVQAYFVDENLARKADSLFTPPTAAECDYVLTE